MEDASKIKNIPREKDSVQKEWITNSIIGNAITKKFIKFPLENRKPKYSPNKLMNTIIKLRKNIPQRIFNLFFTNYIITDFLNVRQKSKRKPARIPSQTLPPRGRNPKSPPNFKKLSLGFANPSLTGTPSVLRTEALQRAGN